MKTFALIGAAGYIAPRHMQAIRETCNSLVAAFDPKDSVGIIDSHFPDTQFFTEFERFDRHIDRRRRNGECVDYVAICSPNYLHDSHVRFALRAGAEAICEKPLVLNPWNIDGLIDIERDTGHRVNTILQLRLHPVILAQRQKMQKAHCNSKVDVDLTYITSRGNWYLQSWKGDECKSGGVATNIGVHLFDMLHFIYGDLQQSRVHLSTPTKVAGYLEYQHARVRWFLSIDINDVPVTERAKGKRAYRVLETNGERIDFSEGFADLHSRSYEAILRGEGFGLEENRVAIETAAFIRTAKLTTAGEVHPFIASSAS